MPLPKIDWIALTEGYNYRYNCNLTVEEMIKDCYYNKSKKNGRPSGIRASEILGICDNVFYAMMIKLGIKTSRRGGHKGLPIMERLKHINTKGLTEKEIALLVGCHHSHICWLKRHHPEEMKLLI